jgi:hypothetical protein
MKKYARKFCTLIKIHFKEYRWIGTTGLIGSFIFPIGILIIFRFMGVACGAVLAEQLLVGTLLLSCINAMMLGLTPRIAISKYNKGIEFYVALPVDRSLLLLSYIVANTILQLPVTVALFLFSKYLLFHSIRLADLSFVFPNIIILGFFGVCALIVGLLSKDPKQGVVWSRIVVSFIAIFTPVYYSVEKLSTLHAVAVRFTPIPYMSDMLRYLLTNNGSGTHFIMNFSVVAVFLLIAFVALLRLDWRE